MVMNLKMNQVMKESSPQLHQLRPVSQSISENLQIILVYYEEPVLVCKGKGLTGDKKKASK